ncbi:MAG: glycosyltransferase family 2 protein [Armatimonadetes bacterium]|nr:glycosyltransferase family 2 protein [Armatimonadota bacterium]
MAGARLILPDGSIQPSIATRLSLRKYLTQQLLLDRAGIAHRLFGEYWLDVNSIAEPILVEQTTGACMCCRREAIAQVGPMDESYWMYCEDSDYCERFLARGWGIAYVPQATMLHVLGGSSKSARAEMIAAYNLAAARYFAQNHGPLEGFLARLIGLLGSSLRLLLWSGATLATLGRVERFRQQVRLFARTVYLTAWPAKRGR